MFVLQMRCQAEDFYVLFLKNEREKEELESNLDIFERMLKFVYLGKIHGLNEVIIVDEVCVCVCVYNMYVHIYTHIHTCLCTHI